jgi:ABC-type oligopeptide transport system substrate-binding subunit
VWLTAGCALPHDRAAVQTPAVPDARRGGELTVAITAPGTVDPAAAAEPSAQLLASTLCDTLVAIDPVTGDPRPALAESWIVADGGRSISFRLRRGLHFSDGSRLTSKDVVASLRRLADPSTASPAASVLTDLAGFDRVATSTGDDARLLLRGARAIEPLSFEVVFEHGRHPDFVRALANPATAPVRVDLADRAPSRFAAQPVCAGPYRLASPYRADAPSIKLVRVDAGRHRAASDAMTGRGAGFVDSVDFRIFPNQSAGYDAWRRHEVDAAPVPPERIAEARAAAPAAVAVGPAPLIEFVGIPSGDRTPLTDSAARRVLAQAIDRVALARDVYGQSRVPANGFLPPSLGRVSRPDACGLGHGPTDAEREGAHLPRELTLTVNDDFRNRALAEALSAQWRAKLGITVRVVALPWDDYLSKVTLGTGVDGLFRESWAPRYASGLEDLGPLFLSAGGGGANLSRFADVAFDRDFELRVAAAVDGDERNLELQRLEDQLCRQLPMIPLLTSQAAVAVQPERVATARRDGRLLSLSGQLLVRELFVR